MWHTLSFVFGRSQSPQPYIPPHSAPENFEEWSQRLRQLEQHLYEHSQKGTELSAMFDNQETAHKFLQTHVYQLDEHVRNFAARLEGDQEHVEKALSSMDEQFQEAARDICSLKSLLQEHSLRLNQQSQRIDQVDEHGQSRLLETFDRIDQLETALTNLRNTALRKDDSDSFSRLLSATLESHLPRYLAVQIDPTSRKVSISPEFWIALERKLNTQNTSDAPASWESFIAQNEASIDAYFNDTLSNKWKDTLISGSVVTRDEFISVMHYEIQSASDDLAQRLRRVESSSNHMSVGENAVKAMVDSALRRYSTSVNMKKDYALSSTGALINPYLTSPTYTRKPLSWSIGKKTLSWLLGGKGTLSGNPPVMVLHPQSTPGSCWAFKGSNGHLGVRLSRPILPTDITVEHVSEDMAMDLTSAPRDIEVWATVPHSLVDNLQALARNLSSQKFPQSSDIDSFSMAYKTPIIRIASFTYDIKSGHSIQSFPITVPIRRLNVVSQQLVFRFLNNWGNSNFTCVYRVQAHGIDTGDEIESHSQANSMDEDKIIY